MANGFDKINLRVPDQWDPVWFKFTFFRDILSKGDVRNAIGSGVAITGNTDEPATLTAGAVNLATGVTGVLPAANIDAAIARDSEVSAAITAHEAASNPHPTYTTDAEVAAAIRSPGYTVATLPASPTIGDRAYVTDAAAPTFLGTLTGGGAVVCPTFYNGAAWVAG